MNDVYLPYNQNLKDFSRKLRNEMTEAEKRLWYQFLRLHKARFVRQKPIRQFIVDFYCSKAQLVIEVDGRHHDSVQGLAYDAERTAILESYGLTVIRFANHEVMEHLEKVCDAIDSILNGKC